MIFEIDPVAKPRMVRSDRWSRRPVVEFYWAFKDRLIYKANGKKYSLGDRLDIIFYVPMPVSWSRRKRTKMIWTPCKQKPDADNLVKAFMDALTDNDSAVWDIRSRKFWSDKGMIKIL